jgi:hypothetical protein
MEATWTLVLGKGKAQIVWTRYLAQGLLELALDTASQACCVVPGTLFWIGLGIDDLVMIGIFLYDGSCTGSGDSGVPVVLGFAPHTLVDGGQLFRDWQSSN